jgi:Fe-S oxidoreductase
MAVKTTSLKTQYSESEFIEIDDSRYEHLLELTDGAASSCFQCGVCTAVCPWSLVRDDTIPVRVLLRQAQLGLPMTDEALWLCTTCAQCEALCPRGVDISAVIRGLRYIAWDERTIPEGLPTLLWSVHWNDNPWSQPPSERSQWAKDIALPAYDPDKHEILLYVGCTSSYDRRAQQIALSLARVLRAAGVSFGYLGEDEPCCGESVLSVGHVRFFQEMAQKAIDVFGERGVTRLVTLSPHCYDVFLNHYPWPKGPKTAPQVYHYTQYVAELIESERLKFTKSIDHIITIQDPCYLVRHNREIDASRRILDAVPGTRIVEMLHSGLDGLCCGGGGGRMWMETDAGERFSDIRIEEAQKVDAQIVATACPFCIVCLEDSVKSLKVRDLRILDVAEILAQSV